MDFVCLEGHVVVELDGGQHQESGRYDAARTAGLNNRGFTVVRFWNNQVFTEMDGVKEAILLALSRHSQARAPTPTLPQAWRRGLYEGTFLGDGYATVTPWR